MRRKAANWQEPGKVQRASHVPVVKKVKVETVNTLTGGDGLELLILTKYRDLAEVFSKRDSDVLPPHQPTNYVIEIMPGAKQPMPKMYSMTLKEMDELQAFIDKNAKTDLPFQLDFFLSLIS